jgi:hypothetical protein
MDDPNETPEGLEQPPVAPTEWRTKTMRTYCAQPGETREGAVARAACLAREHDTVCLIYGMASCVVTAEMSIQVAVKLLEAATKLHLGYHHMICDEGFGALGAEQQREVLERWKASLERRKSA